MISRIKINSPEEVLTSSSANDGLMTDDLKSIINKLEQCAGRYDLVIDVVRNDIHQDTNHHKYAKLLLNQLTPREIEVLHLALQRLPNKEISEKLSISLETVKTHRKRIVSKAGVKNVNHLKDLLFNFNGAREFEMLVNHSMG